MITNLPLVPVVFGATLCKAFFGSLPSIWCSQSWLCGELEGIAAEEGGHTGLMVSPNKLAPVAQTTLKEPLAPCTVTRCRVRVCAVSEPRQPRPLLWAFCACPGFHEHAGVCLKNTSVLRYYDNIDASLAGYSTVALQLWLQLPFCIQIACTWYTQDLASIWIFPCTYRPAFSNCTTFVWDNLQPCECQNLRMKKNWFTSEFHIELLI